MLQEIKYTIKLMWDALTSEPTGLQWRNGNMDWSYIPVEIREWQDERGDWAGAQEYQDFPDYPYYICVAWANGHHTPLPIIIGDGDGAQGALARLFNRYPRLFPQWHAALIDAAYYEHQFEKQEA